MRPRLGHIRSGEIAEVMPPFAENLGVASACVGKCGISRVSRTSAADSVVGAHCEAGYAPAPLRMQNG
jgi:hypothetical protein